jgi:hypothetical protein
MRRLSGLKSLMKFVVAITVFGMATLAFVGGASAKQWSQLQKRYTAVQVQSACIKGEGSYTAGIGSGGYGCKTRRAKVSCNSNGVCFGTNKGRGRPLRTTVIRREFGSEGDRYVCVGECRVVTMCLLEYCYSQTVCDPCARTVVIKGN